MNLNKTYCASNCKNYKCKDMISYSVLKAGERRDIDVKHVDKSSACKDYKINAV